MAVIFIFLDGVGLGKESEENPFHQNRFTSFEYLCGATFSEQAKPLITKNHLFKPIDANLNVDGLPQSGTGQTTLFTGVNAAKFIGKHFGPYPHSGIKPLLKERSLFKDLVRAGKNPHFINAYPPAFFEISKKRNRWSCTTLMVQSAGLKLNNTDDVLNETALTAEIIQNAWRDQLGIDVPEITPPQAAKRLLHVTPRYDLILYEYYLTDKAGHSQDPNKAKQVLNTLQEFLNTIITNKDPDDLLLITSDHGNIEDLSTKSHTRNRVPLIALGSGAKRFENVQSLVDVKEAIISFI